MNTLHLFAGIGGGIVADMMMGHKPVGAVELDSFCRRVLRQRQADGWLPDFPIFNDVRNFDGHKNIEPEFPLFEGTGGFNGYEITEPVDVICGGFPCQPFSSAGEQRGFEDERGNLFFDFMRIVGCIRPEYIFLENSPNVLPIGGETVFAEISDLGYDAFWTCLSAGELGAWHRRDRWWCLGRRQDIEISDAANEGAYRRQQLSSKAPPYSRRRNRRKPTKEYDTDKLSFESDANRSPEWCEWFMGFPIGWTHPAPLKSIAPYAENYWKSEPVPRRTDVTEYRTDRVRALGNAQVPICAATAFQMLMQIVSTQAPNQGG